MDERSPEWIKGYDDGWFGRPMASDSPNYRYGYETGSSIEFDPLSSEDREEADRNGSSNA